MSDLVEQDVVVAFRTRAQTVREKVAKLKARMQRRWDSAPGSFITGRSGRQRSGLDRRWARAENTNRRDTERAGRRRERAAVFAMRARRIETGEAEAQSQARRELKELRAACRAALGANCLRRLSRRLVLVRHRPGAGK